MEADVSKVDICIYGAKKPSVMVVAFKHYRDNEGGNGGGGQRDRSGGWWWTAAVPGRRKWR